MGVFKVVRTTVVATMVSVGILAGATTSWAAVQVPKLVVTPAGLLKGGQVVKVSGIGFKAHDQVFIVECLASASGGSPCNTLGAVGVTINAKGVLPMTKFKVVTGRIGNGTCGTTKANLKSCAISVGNMTGGDSATARIYFIAPKNSKY